MLYGPPPRGPIDAILSPWSYNSLGTQLFVASYEASSTGTWPAAGLLILVPFWIPSPVTVTKVWWSVGGAAAGDIDVGVYDEAANLLVSAGTTAAAGLNTIQSADVTDTVLQRGRYYMGMCASSATMSVGRAAPAQAGVLQSWGCLEQTGITLPLSSGANPATFAKYTRTYIPQFGLVLGKAVGA